MSDAEKAEYQNHSYHINKSRYYTIIYECILGVLIVCVHFEFVCIVLSYSVVANFMQYDWNCV